MKCPYYHGFFSGEKESSGDADAWTAEGGGGGVWEAQMTKTKSWFPPKDGGKSTKYIMWETSIFKWTFRLKSRALKNLQYLFWSRKIIGS